MRDNPRLETDAFDPATLKLMGHALERAWATVKDGGGEPGAVRLQLASAILSAVEEGENDERCLVSLAVGSVTGNGSPEAAEGRSHG